MKLSDINEKDKKTEPTYLYTKEEFEKYDKFIINEFGNYTEVMHEIVSPDIHLDVLIIPPSKTENYYKLITMGMGAYKMNVPKKLRKYNLERAELVLYLPPTWNIKSDKKEDYWPIGTLKTIARLPILENSWLGFGHTVSSDSKNASYASNTKFCSMLLLSALNKEYNKVILDLNNKKIINFYQLFPLYEEELKYKLKTSTQDFLNLIDDKDITPVIDINRKNYCI